MHGEGAGLDQAIENLGFRTWSGTSWRHTAPGRNGLSGQGARMFGGRWNPPESFSVIYTGMPVRTAYGELTRAAELQGLPVTAMLPRALHEIAVDDLEVLDLTGEGLARVGLTLDDVRSDDRTRCQAVGAAAYYLGASGIVAPSAIGEGIVIAAFEARAAAALTLTQETTIADLEDMV